MKGQLLGFLVDLSVGCWVYRRGEVRGVVQTLAAW
jgi:hypothetical protein